MKVVTGRLTRTRDRIADLQLLADQLEAAGQRRGQRGWGGRGSNPRPADYEKCGPVHSAPYLHGYHGAVPLMALIAPIARVSRSTNRSTPHHGDYRMSATERYRARPISACPRAVA